MRPSAVDAAQSAIARCRETSPPPRSASQRKDLVEGSRNQPADVFQGMLSPGQTKFFRDAKGLRLVMQRAVCSPSSGKPRLRHA